MRILLVEDDEILAEILIKYLTSQNYMVDLATNGQAGWDLAEAFEYDVILLDVVLPKLDGISFCKQLRAKSLSPSYEVGSNTSATQLRHTPILMLTAYDSSTSKVTGLDAGADDYLVKPYNFEELLARIRALLRRGNLSLPPTLEWGNLLLDPSICQVTYNKQLLSLTAKEYAILELFLRNTHRIFSQSALLDNLWSFDEPPSENTVRAHIKSLRRKLKDVGAEDLIETVYGLGYRLREISTVTTTISQKPGQIPAELFPFWEKCYEKYSDRLKILENAVETLQENRLSATEQQQAAREAHTLMGSLGSFGLEEACQLSRQIEQILKEKVPHSQIAHLAELVKELRHCLEKSPPRVSGEAWEAGEDKTWDQGKAKPRLLIIDDDRELNQILIAEAQTWGIQGEAVTNLSNARKAIASSELDIILLDLCFPDSAENGLALLEELANEKKSLPVVVFTAQENFSDRLQVARLGAQSFLQKRIPSSFGKL